MFILTLENQTFPLSQLPDEIDELRFAVLDNSNPYYPDFLFQQLIFLESFNAPAMVLKIGLNEIMMPIDWSIAVGDPGSGCDIEILPLSSLNDRGFDAFIFNPLTSFMIDFEPIEITNFYNDVKWYFPKIKPNHLLAMPLTLGDRPPCAYFIKDYTKNSEMIRLERLL